MAKDKDAGITIKHRVGCEAPEARCTCKPGPIYEAMVFDRRIGKKRYKSCSSKSEARAWREDAYSQIRAGTAPTPTSITLREFSAEVLAGIKSGAIVNDSDERFKPSTVRSYTNAFHCEGGLLHEFGNLKLSDIRRSQLVTYRNRLQAQQLDGQTIRNRFMPLRLIYKVALEREIVSTSPLVGLSLPKGRGRRLRLAEPDEAMRLVRALDRKLDRAFWATAFFAGLRRGELFALRWRHVDLAGGVLHVENGWDEVEGEIDTKSKAGVRRIPIAGHLRELLVDHRLERDEQGMLFDDALVFGESAYSTLNDPGGPLKRARRQWVKVGLGDVADGLDLHSARHTFASILAAAEVDIRQASKMMGHASISITNDRYGHMFRDSLDRQAQQLNAFLEAADESSRLEAIS